MINPCVHNDGPISPCPCVYFKIRWDTFAFSMCVHIYLRGEACIIYSLQNTTAFEKCTFVHIFGDVHHPLLGISIGLTNAQRRATSY